MEQTTFVDHALVFQEESVIGGPRTYDTFDGFPLAQTREADDAWLVGTMDRKSQTLDFVIVHVHVLAKLCR